MSEPFSERWCYHNSKEAADEIERLRALVRDAYQEGFQTAGGTEEWKEWWADSEARKALEGK